MLSPNIVSYVADETILAGARVKFVSGSGIRVELADAADVEIGTAILHSGKSSYAEDEAVGVKLINDAGTRTCIAAGAIAAGAPVYRAADGKINDVAAGAFFGFACEAAAADADNIEVLAVSSPASAAATAVVLGSTNGTAGAAANLDALKAETELIGDDVRAIYAALVAHGLLS